MFNILEFIKPGDTILYNTPWDFVDWAIRVKTWSVAAHCEGYVGNGLSVASRNGIGVGEYDFRKEGVVAVLRPVHPFNIDKAMEWFKTVDGQGYDFLGLMAFFLAARQSSPDKMFCSEFLTNWYRAGGFQVIQKNWDADKVAPGNFLMTNALDWVYIAPECHSLLKNAPAGFVTPN